MSTSARSQEASTTSSSSFDESGESLSNSVGSVSSAPTSPASVPCPLQPCGPSILRNPLPPSQQKKRKTSVVITHMPSPPPPHWNTLAASPPAQQGRLPLSPPLTAANVERRRSAVSDVSSNAIADSEDGDERENDDEDDDDEDAYDEDRLAALAPQRRRGLSVDSRLVHGPEEQHPEKSLKFAPLPPGRSLYRSNSLTIGVAARAQMIQSQGGGGGGGAGQRRYAGPMWHEYGGQPPPDIYTFQDLTKGVSKLWKKVRKRSSSADSSKTKTGQAAVEEVERGAKKREIEHIEEADEDECLEDAADAAAIVADGQDGQEDDDESQVFVEAPEAGTPKRDDDAVRGRPGQPDRTDSELRATTVAAAYEPHV